MHMWLPQTKSNTIGELRGSPIIHSSGIVAIPSFFPQDAADARNLESKLNPLSPDYQPDADEFENEEDDDYDTAKRHGKTKRANYAFWLKSDCAKVKAVLKNNGKIPYTDMEAKAPIYHIYPNSELVIQLLTNTKNSLMFFDMETDYEEQNMQCFAFSFDGLNVYSVPMLDYNYRPAYDQYHRIFRALAVAIRDNIIVAHNGAAFDFIVLSAKYKIPVYRCFDTLLAMHRCFPDIEKSLGHVVSKWTWQVFHKDEDSRGYMNKEQMMARLTYCGKDVYTMALAYWEMDKYALRIPGLTHSISTVMDAIVPYLFSTLRGIKFTPETIIETGKENDRLMMQYNRIINDLLGSTCIGHLEGIVKGKRKMFAGSNVQCCHYFHELLGYTVVARSSKTQKPSLGKKAMYKLALQHPDNPVIQLVLAFRKLQKEQGTLKFIPWTDDNGKRGTESVLEHHDDEPNLIA